MASIRYRPEKTKPYQVRYADHSKKSGYAYKAFLRSRDAKTFKAEKDLEEDRGDVKKTSFRVSHAIDKWLEICQNEGTDGNDPVSDYTLENYRYYAGFMKAYEWPCDLASMTTPNVVNFRTWLLENCPSRYVARKTLAYFKTVLGEQVLRGNMAVNVATKIVIKEQGRYDRPITVPTIADVTAMLLAADQLAISKNKQMAQTWKRYRPMIYLAVDSGMRPQEYLALEKQHLQQNGIEVEQAIQGDGKKISVTKTLSGRRFIPLSEITLNILHKHSEKLEDHALLFPSLNGNLQARRNWHRRGFDVACRTAGLISSDTGKVKYTPYDLRHFFASTLIEFIPNLKKIQRMMGHKNIELTLNTYGHIIEDRQDTEREYGKPFAGVIETLL